MSTSYRISLVAAIVLVASSAGANKPRCQLERIDPAPRGGAALRAYATVIEVEGRVLEGLGPQDFTLLIDGKSASGAQSVEPFEDVREPVDIALVVEVTAAYRPAFDRIKEALRGFVEERTPSARVALVTFGSDLERRTPLQPASAVVGAIDELSTDDDSVEIRLVDAIRLALVELGRGRSSDGATPRRLIVVISDGLNSKMDRAIFRGLGDDAGAATIPIHAIAFSPTDERGPLLNLGELSKRSRGTFRWASGVEDLQRAFESLGQEVERQYVVTFPRAPSLAHQRVSLQCGDLVSNTIELALGSSDARRGIRGAWPWLVTGSVVLIATALAILRRRSVPRARLITRSGEFSVLRGISIGKGPSHRLRIEDDPSVSTYHCEVEYNLGHFILTDVGSRNGTFVNGAYVDRPFRLHDGDVIRCGQTELRFRREASG